MSSVAAVTGMAFRSSAIDVEMAILIAGLAATAAATQTPPGAVPAGAFADAAASLFVAAGFTLIDPAAAPILPAAALAAWHSPDAAAWYGLALSGPALSGPALSGSVEFGAAASLTLLTQAPGGAAVIADPAAANPIFLGAPGDRFGADAAPTSTGFHGLFTAGSDTSVHADPDSVFSPMAVANPGAEPVGGMSQSETIIGAAALPLPPQAQFALFGTAAVTAAVTHALG